MQLIRSKNNIFTTYVHLFVITAAFSSFVFAENALARKSKTVQPTRPGQPTRGAASNQSQNPGQPPNHSRRLDTTKKSDQAPADTTTPSSNQTGTPQARTFSQLIGTAETNLPFTIFNYLPISDLNNFRRVSNDFNLYTDAYLSSVSSTRPDVKKFQSRRAEYLFQESLVKDTHKKVSRAETELNGWFKDHFADSSDEELAILGEAIRLRDEENNLQEIRKWLKRGLRQPSREDIKLLRGTLTLTDKQIKTLLELKSPALRDEKLKLVEVFLNQNKSKQVRIFRPEFFKLVKSNEFKRVTRHSTTLHNATNPLLSLPMDTHANIQDFLTNREIRDYQKTSRQLHGLAEKSKRGLFEQAQELMQSRNGGKLLELFRNQSPRDKSILFHNTRSKTLRQFLAKFLAQQHKTLKDLSAPKTLPVLGGKLVIETKGQKRAFMLDNQGNAKELPELQNLYSPHAIVLDDFTILYDRLTSYQGHGKLWHIHPNGKVELQAKTYTNAGHLKIDKKRTIFYSSEQTLIIHDDGKGEDVTSLHISGANFSPRSIPLTDGSTLIYDHYWWPGDRAWRIDADNILTRVPQDPENKFNQIIKVAKKKQEERARDSRSHTPVPSIRLSQNRKLVINSKDGNKVDIDIEPYYNPKAWTNIKDLHQPLILDLGGAELGGLIYEPSRTNIFGSKKDGRVWFVNGKGEAKTLPIKNLQPKQWYHLQHGSTLMLTEDGQAFILTDEGNLVWHKTYSDPQVLKTTNSIIIADSTGNVDHIDFIP